MHLVWRAKARADFRKILDFIASRSPAGADKIATLVAELTERLTLHPYIYRPGRVAGTREAVVHPNYIIVYRVAQDHILIVAVVHARQQYP